VIPGGEGDDAAAALLGVQLGECVVSAAKLEGAGALEIFTFEEHPGACAVIDRPRIDDRRAVRDAVNLTSCAFDVGIGWQRRREARWRIGRSSADHLEVRRAGLLC
jgi:hypothetical protein